MKLIGPEIQPAEPPKIEQLAPVHFITIFYLPILPGLDADLVPSSVTYHELYAIKILQVSKFIEDKIFL